MSMSFQFLVRRVAVGAFIYAAATGLASAQLKFEISGTGANQIPIAIANFASNGSPPQDAAQIVRDDLARSGLFKLVDAGPTPLPDTAAVNYGEWKGKGADAIVVGSVNRLADGRSDVRFKLYDNAIGPDVRSDTKRSAVSETGFSG